MEGAADLLDHDQFNCPICLDLLKEPVTILCGHSYCRGCIKGCWDRDDGTGVYSCPQCRQSFTPRPLLNINTLLAEVVEKLTHTGCESTPSDCYAGPEDAACDVCIGQKRIAVKSCLMCLASYCESHLKFHNKLNPGKRHKLVNIVGQLQDKICSHHDKLMEVYCRTDNQCICYLCTVDKHRQHDIVSITDQRNKKQEELMGVKKGSLQRIQQREEELHEVRGAVESYTHCTQSAVEESERIFTELIQSIERKRSEVLKLIRDQQKAAVREADKLMERLEKEIAELKKRNAEIDHLVLTEDHVYFIQSSQPLFAQPGAEIMPSVTVNPNLSTEDLEKFVSNLNDEVEVVVKDSLTAFSTEVAKLYILLPPEPKTREEFLKYACKITLDQSTGNNRLYFPNDMSVTAGASQGYESSPERFDTFPQVLCREGLSRCCYWEVEWSGNDGVDIAVSYKGISRTGDVQNVRHNDKSWSLECSPSRCAFWHNYEETPLSLPCSSKVGVYLDHRAGTLSFYSVSDTMTLLHRVQTTFAEPLYPGFALRHHTEYSSYSYSYSYQQTYEKGSRVNLV